LLHLFLHFKLTFSLYWLSFSLKHFRKEEEEDECFRIRRGGPAAFTAVPPRRMFKHPFLKNKQHFQTSISFLFSNPVLVFTKKVTIWPRSSFKVTTFFTSSPWNGADRYCYMCFLLKLKFILLLLTGAVLIRYFCLDFGLKKSCWWWTVAVLTVMKKTGLVLCCYDVRICLWCCVRICLWCYVLFMMFLIFLFFFMCLILDLWMRRKTRVSGWEGCGYSVISWAVCLRHSMIGQLINSDQLGCAWEKFLDKNALGLDWYMDLD